MVGTIAVTLGASATQISTSKTPITFIAFSNPASGHVAYAGDSNVSTSRGVQIATPGVFPIGPYSGIRPMYLSDFWLVGTQNDIISVLYVSD